MFSLFLSLIKFHNILVEGSHQNQQIISFVKYLARVSRLKFFLMFFIKHHRKIVHTPLADYLKDLILMSFKEGNPIYLIYFPMTLVYFQKRVRSPPQDISTQGSRKKPLQMEIWPASQGLVQAFEGSESQHQSPCCSRVSFWEAVMRMSCDPGCDTELLKMTCLSASAQRLGSRWQRGSAVKLMEDSSAL